MVLRKVGKIQEYWEFPYSIIETQKDGIIIDITEEYSVPVQATDSETGDLVFEEKVVLDPETGEEIETEQIPVMTNEIKTVNAKLYGVAASYQDVQNPMYFELLIGNRTYNWREIGIDSDGYIGLVKYKPVTINGKIGGNIKKLVLPKFRPLKLVDGKITIDGVYTEDAEFKDVTTGEVFTLADIRFIRDDVCKPMTFPVPDIEDMIE